MKRFETTQWSLVYDHWDPDEQPLRKALCALGNGNFVTRGAAEEARAGDVHYPGTYLAGGYNRLESQVADRIIENEDLVNWPNWLCLNFRPAGGSWFDLKHVDLLEFRQELDVRRGVLTRQLRFRDQQQRETTLLSRRIVHMAQPDLAAIQWTLTPENWSGPIEIDSALDGSVSNAGVARYRDLNGQHLELLQDGRVHEDGIFLVVQTNQSQIRMAQAARTQVFAEDKITSADGQDFASIDRSNYFEAARVGQRILLQCQQHRPICIEKVVAICTSQQFALSEPSLQAQTHHPGRQV